MKRIYNTAGIDSNGSYVIAPAGEYTLTITNITDTKNGEQWKTKNGDDYVSVECEIASGDYAGCKVWHGVTIMDDKTRKGAGMALHFLHAIGEPHEGEIEINTDNWLRKQFLAKLKVGKDNNGKDRNEIQFIIIPESQEAAPF